MASDGRWLTLCAIEVSSVAIKKALQKKTVLMEVWSSHHIKQSIDHPGKVVKF